MDRWPGHRGDGRRRQDGDLTSPAVFAFVVALVAALVSVPAHAGEWSTVVGGPAYDVGRAVEPLRDGGFAVVGSGNDGGDSGILVVRTDAAGKVLWQRHVSRSNLPEDGYGVVEAPDRTLFVLGAIQRPNTGRIRPFLVQLTSEGEEIWNTEDTIVQDLPVDSETVLGIGLTGGDLVLAGGGSPVVPDQPAWFAVIRQDRTLVTFKELDEPVGGGITSVHALEPTPDGGFLVGGASTGVGVVWSLDPDGRSRWMRTFDEGSGPAVVRGVEPVAGGVVLTGDRAGVAEVLRLKAGGDVTWRSELPSGLPARGQDLAAVGGAGFLVARVAESVTMPRKLITDLVAIDLVGDVLSSTELSVNGRSVGIRELVAVNGGWVATGLVQNHVANQAPDLVLMRGGTGSGATVVVGDPAIAPSGRLRHANPVAGSIRFDLGPSGGTLDGLIVVDASGRVVRRASGGAPSATLDVSGLGAGVYHVLAETPTGPATSRFVVTR